MLGGYFFFILYTILFLYLIYRSDFFIVEKWGKKSIYVAFGFKLSAAFLVWIVYSYYYTSRMDADIFKYFDDANVIFKNTQSDFSQRWQLLLGIYQRNASMDAILANSQFWDSQQLYFFNDNRTMIRIHLLLLHFSGGFYHFHSLFFASLSLIGSMGVFRFFKRMTNIPSSILYISSFLIPSLLFWSSAPLKECFLLFSLGIFLNTLCQLENKITLRFIIGLCISLLLLFSLKVYILLSLLIPSLFLALSKNSSRVNIYKIFGLSQLIIFAIILLFSNEVVIQLASKQEAFKQIAVLAKNPVAIDEFKTLLELLQTIPQALFNVFIRPVYAIHWSPFTLMSSLEHCAYILLLFLPLFFNKRPSLNELRLSLFIISFIFTAAIIIGLTTPVLGAIVRYKAVLIPFYLILIFTFVDFSKLKIVSQ